MQTGKVKWYDAVKGFGFLVSDDGKDIFVHRTGLKNSFKGLDKEQKVQFESKDGEKGLVAFDVEVIN